MKSAFEKALERFGDTDMTDYSQEQKEQFAEIDRKYDAKAAQARMNAEQRRAQLSGNPEGVEQIDDDLVVELRSIEERRERDKAAVRNNDENAQS